MTNRSLVTYKDVVLFMALYRLTDYRLYGGQLYLLSSFYNGNQAS